MTHSTLVKLGERWLSRRTSVVFVDFRSYTVEQPDVIGWTSMHSTLIECKVSRADFLRDRAKLARLHPEMGMGFYRYFLTPAGLVRPDEMPARWGLLWATGNQLSEQRKPEGHPEHNRADEIMYLVSMLRRTKLRIGSRTLSEFLRQDKLGIGRSGIPLNAVPSIDAPIQPELNTTEEHKNREWLLQQSNQS